MSLCRCFKILPCTFCTICTFSTQPVLFLSSLYLFCIACIVFLKKIHAFCFHPFRVGHNYYLFLVFLFIQHSFPRPSREHPERHCRVSIPLLLVPFLLTLFLQLVPFLLYLFLFGLSLFLFYSACSFFAFKGNNLLFYLVSFLPKTSLKKDTTSVSFCTPPCALLYLFDSFYLVLLTY